MVEVLNDISIIVVTVKQYLLLEKYWYTCRYKFLCLRRLKWVLAFDDPNTFPYSADAILCRGPS